eukprot:302234-Prymnesium_polylepis.2
MIDTTNEMLRYAAHQKKKHAPTVLNRLSNNQRCASARELLHGRSPGSRFDVRFLRGGRQERALACSAGPRAPR